MSEMRKLMEMVKLAEMGGLNVRMIDPSSVEVENVHSNDYPDFVDAYISYAQYKNGKPLTDQELDMLNDQHSDFVQQAAHKSVF